uniref:Uncharacterized protein n=2 Tax=Euplotes harpa TaxID=151035 RepID=A0A7S3J7L7_9SPIT|mmetsp:Transcript_24521/g.28202  ORF Transcript_24521/g.28202 Transcript_24521/m.28202 type:complete len:122 (+) Transcript_24521:86-451(+)
MILNVIFNSVGNFMSIQGGYVDANSALKDHNESLQKIIALVFTALQIVIELCILFWLFFLFWKTFPFRFGLVGTLFKEFPLLMSIVLINIIFVVAERFTKIYLQFIGRDKLTIYELYDNWG